MNLATIKEVALFLRMKESTLYSWVGSGLIPSFKINGLIRFDMDEIEVWIKDSRNVNEEKPVIDNRTVSDSQVDRIIKKVIADNKETRYNLNSGKPG